MEIRKKLVVKFDWWYSESCPGLWWTGWRGMHRTRRREVLSTRCGTLVTVPCLEEHSGCSTERNVRSFVSVCVSLGQPPQCTGGLAAQLYCILTLTMCREAMVRAGTIFWWRETGQWQPGICFNSKILWKVVKVPLNTFGLIPLNGLNFLEFYNNMIINGSRKEISLLTDVLDKIFHFKAIDFLGNQCFFINYSEQDVTTMEC